MKHLQGAQILLAQSEDGARQEAAAWRVVEEGHAMLLQELKVVQVAQEELEAEQKALQAQLEQGMGHLELAPLSLQDVVVAQMSALSECSCVLGLPY